MDSESKEGAEDRISQLPDDVRVHILSYLPTLCSVRTTVLSKGWNNLWTFVPTLDLDYSRGFDYANWNSFAEFVDAALKLHKPPTITKFRLHIQNNYYLDEEDFRRIQDWICTVMKHELSELDFSFSPFQYNSHKLELELPTSVVRCKTLEVLKLSSSCITYPTTSPGCFPSLKFADITATNRDNSSLRKLFCNCPELQTLRTSIYTYIETEAEEIIINAPKLQNFVVYGRGRAFTKYIMQNVKSLVKANIENTYIPEDEEDEEDGELLNCATALLAGVSSVEYLHLPGPRFETCSLPNFSNLKQLKLNLCGCSYLEYVMELLKRTPKLEDLVLDIDFSSWYDEEYEGYVPFEPPEIVPICVVSHLKTVSITQITGHDDQLDMVKYLLRYGEVLRNMTIVTCGILLFKSRHITEEKFQKEILMYPKISNTCDVEVKFENKGVISDRCSDCGSDRLWCPGRRI